MQCPCHQLKESCKHQWKNELRTTAILCGAEFIPWAGSARSDFGTANSRAASAVTDRRYSKTKLALLRFVVGLGGVGLLRFAVWLCVSFRGWLGALALLAFFFRSGLIDDKRGIDPLDEGHGS